MKRLTLLTLTVLLSACGGGGVTPPPDGGTNPPPSGTWPVFESLRLTPSGTLTEGGAPVEIRVNQAAPAGYSWSAPLLYNSDFGKASFTVSRPDGVNGERSLLNVTGAIAGTHAYTLLGVAVLRNAATGATKDYLVPLKLNIAGTVNYPLYPQVQREPTADEREALRLINIERAKGTGCGPTVENLPAAGPLIWHDGLATAARQHAQDMATRTYFGHVSPEGLMINDLISLAGVAALGGGNDSLGTGYQTPSQLVQGLMNSPAHCRNLMLAEQKYAAVGNAVPTDLSGEKWVVALARAVY